MLIAKIVALSVVFILAVIGLLTVGLIIWIQLPIAEWQAVPEPDGDGAEQKEAQAS